MFNPPSAKEVAGEEVVERETLRRACRWTLASVRWRGEQCPRSPRHPLLVVPPR